MKKAIGIFLCLLLTAALFTPAFAAGEHVHSGPLEALRTETELLPLNADAHAWGEWYTAKEPTVNEEGERRRVCANNPAHVETQPIAKLDPPAQEEPSGGGNAFLSFWQRLINWFRAFFRIVTEWFRR